MTSCGYFFISLPSKCKTPWSRFPERSILLIEQTRAVSGADRIRSWDYPECGMEGTQAARASHAHANDQVPRDTVSGAGPASAR